MKKLLCVLMFGMMFGQTKLETRVFQIDNISICTDLHYTLHSITNIDLTAHFSYFLNSSVENNYYQLNSNLSLSTTYYF